MPLYNGCTRRVKLNRRIFCSVGGLTHLEMKRKRNLKVWLTKCHEIKIIEQEVFSSEISRDLFIFISQIPIKLA